MRHREEVEGNLSLASLMCNLFRTDINPITEAPKSHSDLLDTFLFSEVAYYAMQGKDAFHVEPITKNFAHKFRNTLFHERIHYWQIISCPLQQFRFTVALDRLRLGLARLGGEPDRLCGQLLPRHYGENAKAAFEANAQAVNDSLKQSDALFKVMSLTSEMIALPNVISSEPFTDMPLISIPVDDSKNTKLPGYGAVLGFPGSDERVAFPFNGRYLFESAAYISELLFQGQSVPEPSIIIDTNEQVYRGVWEFWRRLHESRYSSEQNLLIGFLAAVDLALTSDAVDVRPSDGEYEYEMFCLPYRFGKLAYSLLGFPPFELPQGSLFAEAVNDYQERFCSYYGWPAPAFAIKKMMVLITQVLVQSCSPYIRTSQRIEQNAIELFTKPISETANSIEKLEEFWALIADARERAPVFIGMEMLGTMLNACKYRLEFPGRFALPHTYNTNLAEDFPLPVVQMDGEYYLDESWGTISSNPAPVSWPYPIDPAGLLHDCVALTTIRPVKNESTTCGFVEELVDCWYIKMGFGCPQKLSGYTREQQELRNKYKLQDWCHWTPRAVMLRYASPEIQSRWRELWRSAQAQ